MNRLAVTLLSISLCSVLQAAPVQKLEQEKHEVHGGTAVSQAEALRRDMRKLWSDHVFWTRDYAAAAIGNQPDATAAAARLMKNQEDIGNAIAIYYGKPAGDKLTGLLKEHIQIAVDLIQAAKSHDQAKFQDADRKWNKNAEDISDFLSKANPNWTKAALSDLMNMHLATTKQ